MRIGILGPIAWRTPPRRYGPWEQVVAHLAEGLVARGHEVTLFATGDSITSARLVAVCPRPLGEDATLDPKSYEWLHIAQAFQWAQEGAFDLLHNHLNAHPLALSPLVTVPVVTTLHGSALLEPATHTLYRRFRHLPHVSISEAERAGLPELNYVATVYNGVDLAEFPFSPRGGEYLAFLGRMSPRKGAHLAVEVARRTGLALRMAAFIPPDERDFFNREIRPALDGRQITYEGELGPEARAEFLGGARALLHLCTETEPFGLAMVEAQACGTPVVGMGLGSVPEVVADGETGFVVHTLEAAVRAVRRADSLSRRRCREWVEGRFTVQQMVAGYEAVYRKVLESPPAGASPAPPAPPGAGGRRQAPAAVPETGRPHSGE